MWWFRSNRVFGAQAALFALLVQFTVAFGHVHIESVSTFAPAAAATLNITPDELNAPTPTDQRQDPADGACAICATVHLTGSALAARPPALPYPVTYAATELLIPSETAIDDPRWFEQRTRGPPQA